jgi:N-acetyl-gamma-glutamyl-phosphate reductase
VGRSVPEARRQPLLDPQARVVVAGASGFAGALAAQLVWDHPRLELAGVTSRSDAGTRLDELYPRYRVPLTLEELDLAELGEADTAIVAYPHGAAAPVVAALREQGILVVDLSADFRLDDQAVYEQWYGEHGAADLFDAGAAVYGLPELYRDRLADAELIACPGCYPTAALLALAPLAEAGLIEDVVIDAKSGVSGAGREGVPDFTAIDENTKPYKVAGHRHKPEIAQELAKLGAAAPLSFVPHLLPLDQGELVSCYVRASREVGEDELLSLYTDRYDGERFVEVVEAPPGVRDVRDTNLCRVHVTVEPDGGRVMVFAAIDNLWKGAAGQAIQCLNIALGLNEAEGLE